MAESDPVGSQVVRQPGENFPDELDRATEVPHQDDPDELAYVLAAMREWTSG